MREIDEHRAVFASAAAMLGDPDVGVRHNAIHVVVSAARSANVLSAVPQERQAASALRADALQAISARVPVEYHPKIRASITMAAGALAVDGSVPLLIAMADDPVTYVARHAIRGLGRAGRSNPLLLATIIPYLEERLTVELDALAVENVGYVDSIVRALGHLDDRRALVAVERAGRHASFGLTVSVVAALQSFAQRSRYADLNEDATFRRGAIAAADRNRAEDLITEAAQFHSGEVGLVAERALLRLAARDSQMRGPGTAELKP